LRSVDIQKKSLVIPVKTGIQMFSSDDFEVPLDSGFRRSDGSSALELFPMSYYHISFDLSATIFYHLPCSHTDHWQLFTDHLHCGAKKFQSYSKFSSSSA